jgi:hypothetical protein
MHCPGRARARGRKSHDEALPWAASPSSARWFSRAAPTRPSQASQCSNTGHSGDDSPRLAVAGRAPELTSHVAPWATHACHDHGPRVAGVAGHIALPCGDWISGSQTPDLRRRPLPRAEHGDRSDGSAGERRVAAGRRSHLSCDCLPPGAAVLVGNCLVNAGRASLRAGTGLARIPSHESSCRAALRTGDRFSTTQQRRCASDDRRAARKRDLP